LIFTKTKINGVFIVEPELQYDERGFFARSFCKEEFQNRGIDFDIVQCNFSYNKKKGTLRGMHYQVPPFEEAKIINCIKGAIYDVILDLRKYSQTYGQWIATELSDENFKMMFMPQGCAHGFQTLKDDSVGYYQMGDYFHPECTCGIRWNDPTLGIEWPLPVTLLSEKDQIYPNFEV
jgi:dTDP-4-dehydrorhamnose 3,5-epimerase